MGSIEYQYYLGGVLLNDLEVMNLQWKTHEEKSLTGEDLARFQDLSLEVRNDEDVSFMFSPNEPTSIFYGRQSWEVSFQVLNEQSEIIYSGKIKSIEIHPANRRATLSIISDFNSILDKTLEYYNNNTSVAMAFYETMQLAGLKNLIGYNWITADIIEKDNNMFVYFTYAKDKNITLFRAIQDWANLSGSDFFISNGKAEFVQFNRNRFINPTIQIDIDDIIGQPFLTYNNDNILNQYNIQTSIGTLTDEIVGNQSRDLWGECIGLSVNVDNQNPLSSTNLDGLQWAGENTILRNNNPKQYVEFQLLNTIPYQLSLLTTFQFNNYTIPLFGVDISNLKWEIISLTMENNLYTIKAVRLE